MQINARNLIALASLLLVAFSSEARKVDAGLDQATAQRIDAAAAAVLQQTGVPSASIAVVRDGRIVYAQAYGNAELAPKAMRARPAMRYAIGSISKPAAKSAR